MPATTRRMPPQSPTWRCGHPRTPTACCPVCKAARNKARIQTKRPKQPRWICAMTPVQFREAHALYNRWLAEQAGTSRDSTDTAQGALGL